MDGERLESSSRKLDIPMEYLCCGSQQTVGNSSRDGNTRPPDLPPEKSVCRSRNKLEPHMEQTGSKLERNTLRLCIVNLFI